MMKNLLNTKWSFPDDSNSNIVYKIVRVEEKRIVWCDGGRTDIDEMERFIKNGDVIKHHTLINKSNIIHKFLQ